jgi:hypothetical protein
MHDFLVGWLFLFLLVLLILTWAHNRQMLWSRLQEHWFWLPGHVRRDLLRLYLVITVLWVAWYAPQIYAATQGHYYYWRYVSPLFWRMLIWPVGAPILLFVGIWIIAGFSRTVTENEKAHDEDGTARDDASRTG